MRGCLGWVAAILIVGAIGSFLKTCSGGSDDEMFKGPIPRRFQGAYNSIGCERANFDGLVTVAGKSISFGGAGFDAQSVVSKSDTAVTVRGRASSIGGLEPESTFTITYAEVGGMADLNGGSYHRCSQY